MADEEVLITKAEYDTLTPSEKGYIVYWQGSRPGSELKDEKNPYPEGSPEHAEWLRGEGIAVQNAQDSEE